MKKLLAPFGLAALMTALAPCALAEQIDVNTALAAKDRLVTSVSLEDLKALAAADGNTVESVGESGTYSVRAVTSDGLIFNLVGMACDVKDISGCLGVNMQVRYDSDDTDLYQIVNQANLTYAATSTWWDEESQTVGISHYAILDGGQTMGNLRETLTNVLAIGPKVAMMIWPSDG